MSEKKTKKSRSGNSISINKVAFFTLALVAVLYLVSAILGGIGLDLLIIGALQGVATAILIILVAILAWRYVSKKPAVWVVLYIVFLLVVILGIVLPLVLV